MYSPALLFLRRFLVRFFATLPFPRCCLCRFPGQESRSLIDVPKDYVAPGDKSNAHARALPEGRDPPDFLGLTDSTDLTDLTDRAKLPSGRACACVCIRAQCSCVTLRRAAEAAGFRVGAGAATVSGRLESIPSILSTQGRNLVPRPFRLRCSRHFPGEFSVLAFEALGEVAGAGEAAGVGDFFD